MAKEEITTNLRFMTSFDYFAKLLFLSELSVKLFFKVIVPCWPVFLHSLNTVENNGNLQLHKVNNILM